MLSFAFVSNAQRGRITEDFSNVRLSKALKILQKKYHVRLAYDSKLISRKKVNVQLKNNTLEEAMNALLKGNDLGCSVSDKKYVVIYPKKEVTAIKKNRAYMGWVTDTRSMSPIPYAKVKIAGTNKGVYADELGKFLVNTGEDRFSLVVTALGYSKMIVSSDQFKKRKGLNISMKPDIQEFPEIVVEYLAEGITVSKDVSSLTVRPQRMGATPGTTEPDVFRTMQNIPGINSADETVSEMQIRGGTADQNLLIWEGITLYHSGHFNGMISSLNPNMVDKAEIHRGVYSPYYGGRASGLMDFSSMDKLPKKTSFGAGINLVNADAYVKTPIGKKWGLLLSARRSYFDLLPTVTYQKYADRIFQQTNFGRNSTVVVETFEDTVISTVKDVFNRFRFLDINGKLLFQPNAKSKTSISFLRTGNRLIYEVIEQNEDTTTQNYLLTTDNIGVSAKSSYHWNQCWSSKIAGSYSAYQYGFNERLVYSDALNDSVISSKYNGVQSLGWEIDNQFKINKNHEVRFGYQGELLNVFYTLNETIGPQEEFDESRSVSGNVHAFYGNHIWKKKKWLSRIGFRSGYATSARLLFLEPRIYLQYEVNKLLTVKTGYGMQNQFVSQVEDFDQAHVGLSNRGWVLANDEEDLPVLRSDILDMGLVFRWKGWHFEVDAYSKYISGVVNFVNNPASASNFERGNASSNGIDFMLKKRWKAYRTWITYSLSSVKYQFGEKDDQFASPFNQPHVFRWVNAFSLGNLELSMAFKVATGKPYTKAIGLEEDDDPNLPLDERYSIVYGKLNAERLSIYHRLDFTALYTFKPAREDARWRIRTGISILNMYDRKNHLDRGYRLLYNEDTGDIGISTVDRYYLRFTPNILFRFEFE